MDMTKLKTMALDKFPQVRSFLARRHRDVIIDEHQYNMRAFESMVHILNTERQGLIDYDDLDGKMRYNGWQSNANPTLRLRIRDLKLDQVHEGYFLLCRLIAGSYQLQSVNTIVEDPEGDVERLCLYNWSDAEISPVQNLANRRCIPIGTVLLIRNPFYTIASDGYALLIVRSAFDLAIVENYHPGADGIKWKYRSIPRQPKKLKKYTVSSAQTAPRNNFLALEQGPHFIRTPVRDAPRTPRRSKQKGAVVPASQCRTYVVGLIAGTRLEFMEENSQITLICCFIFFVWLLFCAT